MRKIKIRIPAYVAPRTKWRRLIHMEASKVCSKCGIRYQVNDKLEIEVFCTTGKFIVFPAKRKNHLNRVMVWGI